MISLLIRGEGPAMKAARLMDYLGEGRAEVVPWNRGKDGRFYWVRSLFLTPDQEKEVFESVSQDAIWSYTGDFLKSRLDLKAEKIFFLEGVGP